MTIGKFSLRRVIGWAAAVGGFALLIACSQASPDKLVASAKDYLAKGDRPAAIIQLKNALQAAPDNGEARFLLGKASLETRDFPSAEKELRRALDLNYSADAVLPLLARAMSELERYEALINDFGERKLAERDAQASFQALLGDAYVKRNNRELAAKAYATALETNSNYAPAQVGEAFLTALGGHFDEALVDVDSILAREPKLAAAHVLRAELLLAKGDRPGARKALAAAISSDVHYLPARLLLISLLIDERDIEAAAKLIQETKKVAPGDLRVTFLDSSLAFRQRDTVRARQQVQQVRKYAPDYLPALVLTAALDLHDGQLAAAESGLVKVLARVPNHVGARQLLVSTYLRMGQPAKAKETLQPLIDRGLPGAPQLQLLAGETYLASGDVQNAASFYQEAAKGTESASVAARTRLGQVALAAGRSEEGFAELEAASELDAGNFQADLALIAAHLRRNETDKAMAAVQSLEKKQPNNPLTYQMYGIVNLAKRDHEAARKSFEKALELQPTYLPAAHNLAQLDILQKQPGVARKRYEAMIAKEPGNEHIYLAMAELQNRTEASPKEITATLVRAAKANPQAPAARLALINYQLRVGDTKGALAAAQEAVAAIPSDPRVLNAAAIAQEAAGETNRALETYNKLASLQPQAVEPLYQLAAFYVRQKKLDRAIETLRRAQKIAPGERDVVPRLVAAYLGAKRFDDAFREARALQKREPDFVGGFSLEGDIYAAQRNFAEAERLYRLALKLEPRASAVAVKLHAATIAAGKPSEADAWARKWIAENPQDAVMHLYLGERALREKDLKTSASHYRAAISIDEANVVALNNLAWIGGELGDPKALSYADRALKLAPSNAGVLDTYGMLLVKQGEAEKALPYLERAQKIAPARNDLRLNHAKALIKAGKKDAARSELEALSKVTESFAGKDEVAGLLKTL